MTIRVCSECKRQMGTIEDGKKAMSQTDGICIPCLRRNHPNVYRAFRDKYAMQRGRDLLSRVREASSSIPAGLLEMASMERMDRVVLAVAL